MSRHESVSGSEVLGTLLFIIHCVFFLNEVDTQQAPNIGIKQFAPMTRRILFTLNDFISFKFNVIWIMYVPNHIKCIVLHKHFLIQDFVMYYFFSHGLDTAVHSRSTAYTFHCH